jgi:quercetin dioxygenase-like cupin family protein
MDAQSVNPMADYIRVGDQAPAFWHMGILWIVLATAEDTGGAFTLMEQLMAKGPQAPRHLHEWMREGFYLLEGRARFVVDGKTIDAGPGDYVTVPKQTWHEFEALTDLRFLNWYTPGGFEKLIVGSGVPATRRTLPPKDLPPPDPELVKRLIAEVGMRLPDEVE